MNKVLLILLLLIFPIALSAQVKILFNASKAETAGNADWVIDADLFNIGYGSGPAVVGTGNEANPQQLPTPAQSNVTTTTSENYWKGGISAWGIDLVKKGFIVETLPYNGSITYGNSSNPQDLSNYKVFIDCEPNIIYTATEKTAIMQFVQNGGGLFMVSDHTASDRNNDGYDSPEIWNDLMSNNGIQANPFGITFDLATFSQTTTNIPNLPSDPILHGVMGDVTSAMWSAGTSMTLSPAANSSVLGIVYKTGSSFGNSNVMFAYATYGNGKVVAIGDSSPCDDGTGDNNDVLYDGWIADAGGNHERLIMNATLWLAGSGSSSTLSISPTNQNVTVASGAAGFTVTSNAAWTASSNQAWCTVTPSGTGNGSILATYSVNNTSSSRTASITVSVSGVTPVVVTVTQAAPTLSVSPVNQGVTASSGGTSFAVTSNTSWTSVSNKTWCTISSSGNGNGNITVNYDINTTSLARTANITVTVAGLTPVVVTVSQAAPALSVSPSTMNVPDVDSTVYYVVTSNTDWEASSNQPWCSVPPVGSGNENLAVTYTQNPGPSSRIATLTFTAAGLAAVSVTLNQASFLPTLIVSPSNQSVASAAGSTSFNIFSNSGWTASSDQAWCIVTSAGTGNGVISASYSQNTISSSRIANITVSVSGLSPVTVTVSQAAAVPEEFLYTMANDIQTSDYTLEFDLLLLDNDPGLPFELATIQGGIFVNPAIYNGGTISASIIPGSSTLYPSQQPSSVTFTQSANILKLATKSPPGAGNGTIISTNPSIPNRVCRLKLTNSMPWATAQPNLVFNFSNTPYASKLSQYLNGINTPCTVSTSNTYSLCSNNQLNPPPALLVTPSNQTVTSAPGTSSYAVTANRGWTATSDQSWCTINTTGYGNGTITASYTANTSSITRVANITVTVFGLTPLVVTLTQNGEINKTLNLTLFLEGLYTGSGVMHPAMDESGPHWGATIADKINIEFRENSNYSNLVYTASNVTLNTDGTASITFPSSLSGSYYITIQHRNSITIVSANPLSFAESTINYSFDNASKVFGGNLLQKGDGYWVMYGGDANQDGLVDSSDMLLVDNDATNFMTGYLNSDLNGDGLIDAGDMILLDNNAAGFIGIITP